MRKILFTDLDGTLLNNESRITDEMRTALKSMSDAGHYLVLASGRPFDSIMEVKREGKLDFPGIYIIANNGTYIYDCDREEVLKEFRMEYEDVTSIWRLAKENNIHIQTYTDTAVISEKEDDEVTFYRRKIHLPLLLTDEPTSVMTKGPFKMLCIELYEREKLVAFRKVLQECYGERFQMVFSNQYLLEIFDKDAGKGNGLRFLCEYLDIPISNSIAAGDAQNDISMLEAAGVSVAMCNGDADVKAMADVITDRTNHECGLADIINKYIL